MNGLDVLFTAFMIVYSIIALALIIVVPLRVAKDKTIFFAVRDNLDACALFLIIVVICVMWLPTIIYSEFFAKK